MVSRHSWQSSNDRRNSPGSWAGHVRLSDLSHLDPSACRAATIAICGIGPSEVIGADATRRTLETVQKQLQRWSDAGASLFLEWWVGAPGESFEAHEQTLALIDSLSPAKLIGLRPFHWSRHRNPTSFAGREVTFGEPDPDRDLARSIPFQCEGSIPAAELGSAIEKLAARAAEKYVLVPGRVALAYVVSAEAPPPRGPLVRLAEDAAIVQLPSSLDGKPQATWYAVQLKTRAPIAMDARLAPALSALTRATAVEAALPQLPAPVREKVIRQLVEKRILVEVES